MSELILSYPTEPTYYSANARLIDEIYNSDDKIAVKHERLYRYNTSTISVVNSHSMSTENTNNVFVITKKFIPDDQLDTGWYDEDNIPF